MLSSLVFGLLIIGRFCHAEIPLVTVEQTAGFGQCLSDQDCAYYINEYPSLNVSQIFCNTQTLRCNYIDGTVLTPTFKTPCDAFSMTTISYPSIACAGNVDGMIMVTVNAPMAEIHGVLRLFPRLGFVNGTSINTTFVQQIFINAPVTQYIFRNVAPGDYAIQYFQESGCFSVTFPQTIRDTFDNVYMPSSYPPFGTVNCQSQTNFIRLRFVQATDPSTSFGVGIRMGISPTVLATNFMHVRIPADVGQGQRVPYAHVLDMQGGILATFSGDELYVTGSFSLGTTLGGVTYPLNAQNITNIIPTQEQAMTLSGIISIQFGMGYAYRATDSSPVVFVQDADGDYEGMRQAPLILNLTNTTGMNGTIGNYNVGPMRFVLSSIYSNTRFMYSVSNVFNASQMVSFPIVTVGPLGCNSFCSSSTSTSLTVTLDYRGILFPSNTVTLRLFKVQYNPGLSGTSLVAASNSLPIVAGIWTRTVSSTGSYCAIITANLLDGYGFRPILQTCFQVGLATASITQVSSDYLARGTGSNPYPYLPYSGYGTIVRTYFYVTLPTTIVIAPTQTILLQLFVLSNSTLDTEQLEKYDGSVIAVFNDNQGNVPLSRFYTVTELNSRFVLYQLKLNVFSGNEFFIDRNAAASIVNTYAFTKFFIIASDISFLNDYFVDYETTPGDANGNGQTNTSTVNILYTCNTATYINMIEALDLQASIIIDPAICPENFAFFSGTANGGFPFYLSNPTYTVTSLPTGVTFPFGVPVSYLYEWTIVSTDETSLSGVGANVFPGPPNQVVRLSVTDANGNVENIFVSSASIVPPSATVITFRPQVPICLSGSQQAVILEFVLNRPFDNKVIYYYAPLDPTAREIYDPNTPFFDLPSDCALLNTLTAYQVYILCQKDGGTSNGTVNCTGCTRLPIQYPQAFGTRLISGVDSEWWEITVWVETDIFDFEINRYIWCRTSQSISTFIAEPLGITFSQPVFIPNPDPTLCPSRSCFSVQIEPVIDPRFQTQYNGAQTLLSAPLLPFITQPNTYLVQFGTEYNITMFIGQNICPVTVRYTPTAQGPLILLIRTTQTNCASNDGTAVIYVRYNNPSSSAAGTTVDLCLYWPLRRAPSEAVNDAIPIPFVVPVGPQATLLPNDNIQNNRFTGIRAGIHQLLIYEACAVSGNSVDCTSCLLADQFSVTLGRRSAYQKFTVDTAANKDGGLRIERTGFQQALCCGDNYIFNFTFRDDIISSDQRYSVEFFYPFNRGVFVSFSQCTGPQQLPQPRVVNDFQVEWSGFNVVAPTCGDQGIGFSGNYTFVVKGCTSGCVATFETYIDAVSPFDITLSTAGTSCAYSTAQLLPQVIGGSPYQPYDNFTLIYSYPGSNILYFSPYRYCWKTPFNPNVWDCTFLQLDVIPGFYQFEACDRNQCCGYSNITVLSAPPIDVSIVGFDQVCQTSNQSTIFLNVTGGIPPYFVLENVTSITTNTSITATFAATFNQTSCFNILDSSGCVRPTEVCFRVPSPGPVNLTILTEKSCKRVATGSATITSDQPITCTYLANNVTIPVIQTCSLVNLPSTAFITVTATTIIGCSATESFRIGQRTPIVMVILSRTVTGIFDGPCIDNITISITGGDEPPPYLVALFDDATNATLNYNNNNTILITGVCRNAIYTVVARENDGSCPEVIVSSDPQFNFGSGGGFGLVGLPPPNLFFFIPLGALKENKIPHLRWGVVIAIIVLTLIIVFGIVLFFALQQSNTKKNVPKKRK